jgi:hypothetical protein
MPDQDANQPPATIPAGSAPAAVPTPPTPVSAGAPGAAQGGQQPSLEQRVDAFNAHLPNVGEALSNLAHLIPGFAGYKAVEDRRIADKQLRAVIGERLTTIKDRLDRVVESASRAGSLDGLALIDQTGRRLERLIDRMRFADYGYSAVFDRVQLGEPELARLYQYDTAIMNELGSFDAAVIAVESSAGDPAKLAQALANFDALTAEFDRRFEARQHLFDPLGAGSP